MPKNATMSKMKMIQPGSFNARDFIVETKLGDVSATYSEISDLIDLSGKETLDIDSAIAEKNGTSPLLTRLTKSIFDAFEFSSKRVYSLKYSIYPIGSSGCVSPGLNVNGGRVFTIISVPDSLVDTCTATRIAELIAMDEKKDFIVESRSACEVLKLTASGQGGVDASSSFVLRDGVAAFLPFGFSQMISVEFDNSKFASIPSTRNGGRPVSIKKNSDRRLVVCADISLTGNAISKTLTLLSEINEKIATASQEKRNTFIMGMGKRLVSQAEVDEDGSISLSEIASSIVKLVRSNNLVKNTIMNAILKAVGKDSPHAKTVLLAMNTISTIESVDDAIEKMKELMLSSPEISRLVLRFMGKDTDSLETVPNDENVYED